MSDLHIEICEDIEDVMCEELCMEKCEKTYEIALRIFEIVNAKLPKQLNINHVDTLTIN